MSVETPVSTRTRTKRVPRSRGAISGLLLILLGAWGALVPFIGPYFDYSWGTDQTWHWTTARFWLEVLPGAVTVVGGWLVLVSKSRISGSFGGWLAVAAGGWFVVDQSLAGVWHLGSIGNPLSLHPGGQAAAMLGYFYGLGALIVLLAGFALGRLAVVGLRDIRAAERDDQRAAEAERQAEAERRAAAERQLETDRHAEAERRVEAERQEAVEREAAERQTATEREAAERQSAAERKSAAERQAGPDRVASERPVADDRATAQGYPAYNPSDGRSGAADEAPAHRAPVDPDQPYGTS
jgi:hypothetical protein